MGYEFDMASCPNQLLEALKYFEVPMAAKNKAAFSWGQQPESLMHSLAGYITSVAVRMFCY